jgi:hypothetical protein
MFWAENQPANAARAVDRLIREQPEEPNLRWAALYVVQDWAKISPTQTAAWLEQLPEGKIWENAVEGLVRPWIGSDVEQARDWALSQSPDRRDTAVEKFMEVWSHVQPQQAAEWLDTLDSGPLRDVAVTQFTRTIVPNDPLSALEYADTLSDPADAAILRENLLNAWKKQAPEEAQAWLDTR